MISLEILFFFFLFVTCDSLFWVSENNDIVICKLNSLKVWHCLNINNCKVKMKSLFSEVNQLEKKKTFLSRLMILIFKFIYYKNNTIKKLL